MGFTFMLSYNAITSPWESGVFASSRGTQFPRNRKSTQKQNFFVWLHAANRRGEELGKTHLPELRSFLLVPLLSSTDLQS